MELASANLKTPEDFKKYSRAGFRAACGEDLWKFLEEKEDIIYDRNGNPHEPGCPAIADDESDYKWLLDAGICCCSFKKKEKENKTNRSPDYKADPRRA